MLNGPVETPPGPELIRAGEPDSYRWMTPTDLLSYAEFRLLARFTIDLCADSRTVRFGPVIQDCFDDQSVEYAVRSVGPLVVWMNPPFGGPKRACSLDCGEQHTHNLYNFPGIQAFIARFLELVRKHRCPGAFITESATGDLWYRNLLEQEPRLRAELLRRVKFLDPVTGKPGMQPKSGHTLWYYSPLGWGPGSRIELGDYEQGADDEKL